MTHARSPLVRWLPVATVIVGALAAALWLTVNPAVAALPDTAPDAAPNSTASARAAQAEFNRVVEYMAYAQAAQRFRALREQARGTPELLALARQLDAGLPQRLARGELSAGEAQALQEALNDVLSPEAATAARRLQAGSPR